MKKVLVIVVLGVLLIAAGAIIARAYWPRIIDSPPEILYRERPIAPRDTATTERPEVKIIYEQVEVEKLVRDTIYVPIGFSGIGVISPTPIKFSRGNVVLTYFGLRDSAFVQDRFRVPRPNFGYYLSTVTGYNPFNQRLEIGFEAAARWRFFTAYTRISTTMTHSDLTIGLRIRLKGNE